MYWYFEPRRGGGGAGHDAAGYGGAGAGRDDDDSAPGLTFVPAALLQRHGARVLNPGDAAAVPGYRTPRSTVYRTRTLLIPADLLPEPAFLEAIRAVLARVGLRLIPPPAPEQDRVRGSGQAAEALRRLPRPAVLAPAIPADGQAAQPVVVDAWTALQALRASAGAGEYSALDEQAVRRIALEHLLIGSAITGSPATEGNGLAGSPATEGNGVTGPGSTDSYVYGGGTRAPVAVCLDAPRRKQASECGSRRPVVAVLDTGVRAHPWLDVRPDPPSGYHTINDGFVAIDPVLQQVIYQESEQAASSGDQPRQLIRHAWDTPVTADPLIGELDTDTGHGTFIAGIVRQVAPDGQVLAVRVMHSDGVVYEGDLICALGQLADRIGLAEAGDMAAMVDVVSLSLGYFDESAADVTYSSGLWQVIRVLLGLGVAVVAAGGNYATSRRFYPAAFALEPAPAGGVPVISVGALNPDGSKALFSDGGRWITAWASGAAMVSTFPTDINGSLNPQVSMRAHPGNEMPAEAQLPAERAALDPDNYRSGFAVWSGTSFSAPLLAALIARSLLEKATDPALGLELPGPDTAKNRAVAALQNIGWRG